MFSRPTGIAAVAVMLAVPTFAGAQTGSAVQPEAAGGPAIMDLREVDDDSNLTWEGRSIDEIEDMDLYSAAGEKIGEVEEILADADGRIQAFAIELEGEFERNGDDDEVAFPVDRLRLGDQDDRLVTDMAGTELQGLPVWDD